MLSPVALTRLYTYTHYSQIVSVMKKKKTIPERWCLRHFCISFFQYIYDMSIYIYVYMGLGMTICSQLWPEILDSPHFSAFVFPIYIICSTVSLLRLLLTHTHLHIRCILPCMWTYIIIQWLWAPLLLFISLSVCLCIGFVRIDKNTTHILMWMCTFICL